MIDIKELRIGNLGYSPTWGIVMTWGPSRNAPDYPHYGWEASDGEGLLLGESCKRIEPIPLTPEWLERAGFEKIDYGGIRLGGVDEMDSAGKYVLGNFTIHYLKKFWIKTDHYIWVESVHQLQNLIYANTGEELTITMPLNTSSFFK